MGVPRRKGVAAAIGVQHTKGVDISRLEHERDGLPANRLAGEPRDRAQPRRQPLQVERFTGRQRVEVADDEVESPAVGGGHRQQPANFAHAAPLGPVRVDRAEVHADHRESLARHDLEHGVLGPCRTAPARRDHRLAAQARDRRAAPGQPRARVRCPSASRRTTAGDVASCSTTRSASGRGDDGTERLLPGRVRRAGCCRSRRGRPSPSALPMRVRYGWPSTSPRRNITMSRVAWMLTGRSRHRHQPLPQRHQCRRDVGVGVAQRPAVDARNEEAPD